jgi:hypothetical protein
VYTAVPAGLLHIRIGTTSRAEHMSILYWPHLSANPTTDVVYASGFTAAPPIPLNLPKKAGSGIDRDQGQQWLLDFQSSRS